jgi:WG containing repeat
MGCGQAVRSNGRSVVISMPQAKWSFPPAYDVAGPFSKGHAVVQSDGRFGIIDETGTLVAPVEYDGAGILPGGELLLHRDGTSRLLDTTGQLIVEAQAQVIRPLDADHALLGDGSRYFDPTRFDLIDLFRDATWRVRTLSTGDETAPVPSEISFIAKDTGLPFWQRIDESYYLTAPDGQRLTGALGYGGTLQNGLIQASKDDRWGFIDPSGRTVIDFQFDWVSTYGGRNWTVFRVGRHDTAKLGFLDEAGKIVIPAQFDEAFAFEGDFANVVLDGARITIDRTGWRTDACKDAFLARKVEGGFHLLRPDGTPLNDQTYDYAKITCGQPTLVVTKDGRSAFLNAQGALVGDRFYWRADPFHDGVAVVWGDATHVGIIDTAGRYIVQPIRSFADFTSAGTYTVINPGPDHVIVTADVARALAIDPSLLTTPPPKPPDIFCPGDGVDIVEKDGAITYLDTTSQVMFEGAFDFATCFYGRDRVWVAVRDRREWCKVDKRGRMDVQTCNCHQPVVTIESWGIAEDKIDEGLDCYDAGLKVVGPFADWPPQSVVRPSAKQALPD